MAGRRNHPFYRTHCLLNWLCRTLRTRKPAIVLKFFFAVGAVGASAFLTILGFADPTGQDVPKMFEEIVRQIHENRLVIACVLLACQVALGFMLWVAGLIASKTQLDVRKLRRVLDTIVDDHFPKKEHEHVYRATLFKLRHCWLVGSWLGVVQRSGELYPKWNTIFSISKQTKTQNTGLAGECWWRANARTGESFYKVLPDYRSNTEDMTLREAYAIEGYADVKEVERVSVCSQFFRVAAIRVQGEIWGVLVLDSTDPGPDPLKTQANRKQQQIVEQAAATIMLLIE